MRENGTAAAVRHTPCIFLIHFFENGGETMPRMSKKRKEESAFFLDERNRIRYCDVCRKCEHECKQSFRAGIVSCPKYKKKKRT